MDWFEAFILGTLQGLTEFLPVSSSGHLELGKYLFGVDSEVGLAFTVSVHGATVLSTIIVFRKELSDLVRGLFRFRWNSETRYIVLLLWSMVPVGIAGLFFKDSIESLFEGKLVLVGLMLIVTALILFLPRFFSDRGRDIGFGSALIIGLAQAVAVIPGISRSGATISTGMMLGISRDRVAGFSFLMVLLPVIGANMLEFADGQGVHGSGNITEIVIGFVAAFVAGLVACRFMLALVKKSGMWWFSIYCLIVGLISIMLG
jgi:undecaprenyl-diphosphatase